jgi:hypothetical protein
MTARCLEAIRAIAAIANLVKMNCVPALGQSFDVDTSGPENPAAASAQPMGASGSSMGRASEERPDAISLFPQADKNSMEAMEIPRIFTAIVTYFPNMALI